MAIILLLRFGDGARLLTKLFAMYEGSNSGKTIR